MKIPAGTKKKDRDARYSFLTDILQKCWVSREDRRGFYDQMRTYYLFGKAGDSDPDTFVEAPPGNKLRPHVDQLCSFMYAQDTTRFSVTPGASVPEVEFDKLPRLNQAVNDQWHNSDTDLVFGSALQWSFVYGKTFIKPIVRMSGPRADRNFSGINSYVVMPHNVGVLREDVPQLHRQEAFCICYYVTLSQLRNELEFHPAREEILKKVYATPRETMPAATGGDSITMSAMAPLSGGAGSGAARWMDNCRNRYIPKVAQDLVEMTELYIQDDEIGDYRVITFADPMLVIYDRPGEQLFLPGEPPLVEVCPRPAPDYFWGHSEVEMLVPLQQMRNERLAQIRHLCNLSAHSPAVISGFPGDIEEMQNALDTPNGFIYNGEAGASGKAERVAIDVPADIWRELGNIDEMFEEMSGITNVMQGRGESGVRSTGHASQLARLGSSRAKQRALIVEDSLEDIATLYLKIMRKYDPQRLKTDAGMTFVADQFTEDFVVKVDAHSNSPIFVEDQTQMVFAMLQAHMITRDRALDLLPVPMRELLKKDLKSKIEPAEAQAAQEQKQLELVTGRKAA